MAAAHAAILTEDGDDTLIRVTGRLNLAPGPVLVHEEPTGEISIAPVSEGNPWLTFFEAMDASPRDAEWESFMQVMEERPMNRLPVEKNLFPETE